MAELRQRAGWQAPMSGAWPRWEGGRAFWHSAWAGSHRQWLMVPEVQVGELVAEQGDLGSLVGVLGVQGRGGAEGRVGFVQSGVQAGRAGADCDGVAVTAGVQEIGQAPGRPEFVRIPRPDVGESLRWTLEFALRTLGFARTAREPRVAEDQDVLVDDHVPRLAALAGLADDLELEERWPGNEVAAAQPPRAGRRTARQG
jgi:hypothetical protein